MTNKIVDFANQRVDANKVVLDATTQNVETNEKKMSDGETLVIRRKLVWQPKRSTN